jgi:hypothetical protein
MSNGILLPCQIFTPRAERALTSTGDQPSAAGDRPSRAEDVCERVQSRWRCRNHLYLLSLLARLGLADALNYRGNSDSPMGAESGLGNQESGLF